MEKIDKLLEISTSLNLEDVTQRLLSIKRNYELPNAKLTLPLVGEFSSGKTTLINALTDSKKLETATTPTTAALYRIHFGSENFSAKVWDENGEHKEILDEEGLSNEALKDASWVDVYDTSTKLPSSIVLIDTPGLSSPIPRHRETLMKILPEADGVLLVSDVNQQLTRSLSDFVKITELIKCPIFLVLTKSDTKSSEDINVIRKYIKDNNFSQIKRVIAVSAKSDDLGELFELFKEIEKEKSAILEQVNEHRIKTIGKQLISYIDELLKASSTDESLDNAIRDQEIELDKLNDNIKSLIDSTVEQILETEKHICREFEDETSEKLERMVVSKTNSYDSDAASTINSIARLLFSNYKNDIREILSDIARNRRSTEDEISLRSLEDLDLSNIDTLELSYNLDLNSAGHEKDKLITNVIKGALVIGAITAATVVATTAAAATATKAAAEGAKVTGKAVAKEAAKSISKTALLKKTIKTTAKSKATEMVFLGDDENKSINLSLIGTTNEMINSSNGVIHSFVSKVTDDQMGKPQRKRLIRNYLNETLLPTFKSELMKIRLQLTSLIGEALHIEATETINQKSTSLEKLQSDRKENNATYENRIKQLRNYKKELITL